MSALQDTWDGKERRKTQDPAYFDRGGIERRKTPELRAGWDPSLDAGFRKLILWVFLLCVLGIIALNVFAGQYDIY